MENKNNYPQEDVTTERVDHLIEERVPWLFVGLLGGLVATFIISHYEAIISSDVRLAFFIPIVVYLSGAVGMQTETIYVRELVIKKVHLGMYVLKESIIGLCLGIISGAVLGFFANLWLKSSDIGLTLAITMIINLTLAPILGVFIPSILYKEHTDPALGAGPVATIIQDLISLLIYFFVAKAIIF